MSALLTLIPVTQKAPNVCVYCRLRKQACDRTVPRCSRCAVKGRSCDYTMSPFVPIMATEPLMLRTHSNAPLLSSRGARKLVQVVSEHLYAISGSTSTTKLSDYVTEILNLASVDLISIFTDYGPSVRHWCPIVHECMLEQGTNFILTKYPLLALGVWLVTERSREYAEHRSNCQLYQALKQVLALLQTKSEVKIEALQLGLSIAVYEVGHGMGAQALQSISSCKAMLIVLEYGAMDAGDMQTLKTMEWLKASLLMLDRILFIATLSTALTLTIPPSDPICAFVFTKYAVPPIAPLSPTLAPTSPPKVHLRTVVAFASGHALDYVHARRRDLEPRESYDAVDNQISNCIKLLIENPQPATWLHCDAIALGFCSHVLLQQAQVHYLAQLPHSVELHEHKEKASLALSYSRRMAWDMVVVALGKIESEEEVARLPFAALCCVLRAGIAVLETSKSCESNITSREETKRLQRVVRWFGARWEVGRQYEARLADVINHHT